MTVRLDGHLFLPPASIQPTEQLELAAVFGFLATKSPLTEILETSRPFPS